MGENIGISRPAGVVTLAAAASLAAHVLSLAVPLALLQTYDRILPNHALGTTFILAVGVSLAILLEAVLRYGRSVLFAHVGALYEWRMKVALLDHLMHAEGHNVQRLGAPALSDAMRAVGQVRDFWSGNAGTALHEAPFIAIYIGLIAYVGGWLALIPLSLTLVALIAALAVARSASGVMREVDAADGERRDLTWGIFAGLVHARSMAAEAKLGADFGAALSRSMATNERLEILQGLIRENGAFLAQVSTIATVAFGAFMVVGGQLTTGGLAACTMLAGRSIGPAMGAFAYLSRQRQREEAEARIANVLSLPVAPVFAGGTGPIFEGGTIRLSGEAIVGSPIEIPQGTFVRVAAADAYAASSLLASVARLADMPGLAVTYDGRPGLEFDAESLNRNTATVVARPRLVRGTILDNLTLFAPQYDAEAIALSDRLGFRSFVDGLRDGFMTQVGDVGAEILGGGLAARIGLVRALARRPLILCLDQADATLDLDGVKRLVALLMGLRGQVTVFIATSNPSLVGLTDQAVTVRDGSGR